MVASDASANARNHIAKRGLGIKISTQSPPSEVGPGDAKDAKDKSKPFKYSFASLAP